MKRTVLLLALLLFPLTVSADPACPCFPHDKTWIVTYCDTWNCASSALVMANGDPYVMAVPTSNENYRWVVVRRVVSGSVAVSPDEPFEVESFTTAMDGALRMGAIDSSLTPMMITTPDSVTLVVSLKPSMKNGGKKRSVQH